MKNPLVVLTGPTAVGKTALSIALAKSVNGSIISADSIQVYRQMDIGSAKIKPEEMQGIPHYLIDILDPKEAFDIVTFQRMAKEAMEEIYAQGRIPILVGGTGFYIQSILKDIAFEEETEHSAFRNQMYDLARQKGPEFLHARLQEIDPVSAKEIHPNNVKRVTRALEFYQNNGYPISEHNANEAQKESPYNYAYFVLNQNRKTLYQHIEARVDLMMKEGLLDEVKSLVAYGADASDVSMQGLGYKELLSYLHGDCSLERAIEIIKRDTRHFAKRQLTWFRRESDVIWIDKDAFQDEDAILEFMLAQLKEKQIL